MTSIQTRNFVRSDQAVSAMMDVDTSPKRFQPPRIRHLRFLFTAIDTIHHPDYPGSAWRGLLGQSLRKSVCVTRQPVCTGCLLLNTCVYSTLFETPIPPGTPAAKARVHPFVLRIDPRAPKHYPPNAPLSLDMILLGDGVDQVSYLIHAMMQAGQRGFGRQGGRFRLTAMQQEMTLGGEDWTEVFSATDGRYSAGPPSAANPPPPPTTASLQLVTPLRIKQRGHFLGVREFSAHVFVLALYRRLAAVADHLGGEIENPGPRGLEPAIAALELKPVWLDWRDWTRYSSRQDSRMQLGGLIGECNLAGDGLAMLWPLLWAGQWLHVGKNTTFGLGGYRLIAGEASDGRAQPCQR